MEKSTALAIVPGQTVTVKTATRDGAMSIPTGSYTVTANNGNGTLKIILGTLPGSNQVVEVTVSYTDLQ